MRVAWSSWSRTMASRWSSARDVGRPLRVARYDYTGRVLWDGRAALSKRLCEVVFLE